MKEDNNLKQKAKEYCKSIGAYPGGVFYDAFIAGYKVSKKDTPFDDEDILGALEVGFNEGMNFDEDMPNVSLARLIHIKDNYIKSITNERR